MITPLLLSDGGVFYIQKLITNYSLTTNNYKNKF